MNCSVQRSVCPAKRCGSARSSAALTPTSTPGGADSRSDVLTHPSNCTRAHSPDLDSTLRGVEGVRVPAGGPSGARYTTVRRGGWGRGGAGGGAAGAAPPGGPRRPAPGAPPPPARRRPADPSALGAAPRHDGAARQARQPLAGHLLIEPLAVRRDAVARRRLDGRVGGGGGKRRREGADNW